MVNLFEAIKERRAIRHFKKDEVPREYIYKIIDAARYAPSAGNLQPWEFIVIEDQTTQEKIAHACISQKFISDAPVVIVACADTERSAVRFSGRGKMFYSVCDVSAAVENLILAAHAFGLGTCWVGGFDDKMLAHFLKLPKGVAPIAVIPLGYPASEPKPPKRTALSNILHFGEYGRYKKLHAEGLHHAEKPIEKPKPKPEKKRKKGLIDLFR